MEFDNAHNEPCTFETLMSRMKMEAQFGEESTDSDYNPWNIVESYFSGHHLEQLVRHQLESFNNFVSFQIPKTIEMFNPVHIVSEKSFVPELGKYNLEVDIVFENFQIFRPQIHENNGATKLMFPQEARIRNFTYASNMTVDIQIKYTIRKGERLEDTETVHNTLRNIHIGKLPIMLKSNICVLTQHKHLDHTITGECQYDAGGYFIINGSEKTVLGQERAAENRVYCFNVSKGNTKWIWNAEIKSVPDFKCISPKQINIMISSKNNGFGHGLYIQIPRVKQPIPLFVAFRALGVIPDKEICEYILLNLEHKHTEEFLEALGASIVDASSIMSKEDAIQYITSYVMYTPMNMDRESGIRKKREFTLEVIANDLFPHCQTVEQKIYFMGYMTNKLLQASFELIKQDDRDSYVNKRIDLTGALLNNLFRNYFNKLVKDMQKQVMREISGGSWRTTESYKNIIDETNIDKIIKSATIENGLRRALSTGDFGVKHSNSNKVGVAQVLGRLTYLSSLSHLRRINTPIDKSGKLIPPRKLHATTWGYLCLAETPEGQSVGVVKNLSYLTHVTIPSNSLSIYDYVQPYIVPVESMRPVELYNMVKVFVNGAWIGVTHTPIELYRELKEKKLSGIMNIYTSVIFDYRNQEIRVCNDSGRLVRPLLRVKDGAILFNQKMDKALETGELTWNDLIVNYEGKGEGVIEYIDPEEQNWSLIAMRPADIGKPESGGGKVFKYTHAEIHPSTIFGVLASCIPFPEHNQSPRNIYQCAMGKQAMGMYMTNYDQRMDKTAYVLTYPTRPLVDTRLMNMIQLNNIPSGTQVVVAIMTHTGYNQEDSLLFNKGSLDRGLFQATIIHTEKDEDKKINGNNEIRKKPDPLITKGCKLGNYDKVNDQGVIPENTLVENRDIIISKVVPIKENRNDPTKVIKFEDQSRIYRTTEETYVDKNCIGRNGEGYDFCKVRLRILRKPVIGDKFSSRHGQKGTIGNIIPEEDMPYTSNGLKPDIILNPHAIPSRMTIGQLKETVLGKFLIQMGLFGDGTSFGEMSVKSICKALLNTGYESYGNEIMYNALTGEQMETAVFIGPVFYQRLKHMVNDKQHSRSIGPMVNLTRQPAEGRSRDGGLRYGEMERDCIWYHTPITTPYGISLKIGEMAEYVDDCDKIGSIPSVLGWREDNDVMVSSRMTHFLDKGEKECVQVTLQDGRKLVCTDNHPVLTSTGEWKKISELTVDESRLKTGVTCPVISLKDELTECNGWSLNVGTFKLTTESVGEYMKTLAFARILGYLIMDGTISSEKSGVISLGHIIDVNNIVKDLSHFNITNQTSFGTSKNYYSVRLSKLFTNDILTLDGITVGRKVVQDAELPAFIVDPGCPRPIVREFLAGMFGADGHTCVLGLHRGKRDILTSISFSKTRTVEKLDSLIAMMDQVKCLLNKCGIHKITIQTPKETSNSKKSGKYYQVNLHLDIDELIPFSENIGFRYCCHKSQRLEAGVTYKRLRNEVVRQHNWLVNRVDEITNFTEIKRKTPEKKVQTRDAIKNAIKDLQKIEPLIHTYAIPSAHDITDHLIKGTSFGKFSSSAFPTAEEFLQEVDAFNWFIEDELNCYGVSRDCEGLPTMNLKVIDIRPAGLHKVYDISVDETHSFLANGVVAHNCMISHGAARFNRGRIYDASDKYTVNVCNKCGLIAAYNDKLRIHHCKTCDNRSDFSHVELPYSCKLLFQELMTMNVCPRILTEI